MKHIFFTQVKIPCFGKKKIEKAVCLLSIIFMLRKIFFICFSLFATLPILAQSGDAYDGGIITAEVKSAAPIFRVGVHGDAEAKALATRALGTHGSFKVVPSDGQYDFEFARNSDTSVILTIKGAKPFTQTVHGKTFSDAVAKACDVIVKMVLGKQGYFSGQLVFVSDRTGKTEIYTSDMLFQNIRALTADNSDSMLPHWSPDGSKVLYTGYYRTQLMDLYEIDLNLQKRRTFASYKGMNTGGAYSPDGKYVSLILTNTGNAEIWRLNSDGTSPKRLTKNKSVEASASWSPDGTELIFSSDAMGGPQIYRMSANGGQMSRIPTNISRYCSEPDWNKVNPNLIAFTAATDAGFQIAVYDFATKEAKFITSGGSASHPKWLNDGRHLVYTRSYGGARAVYIVDSITGKYTRLHSDKVGSCGEADFIYTNN